MKITWINELKLFVGYILIYNGFLLIANPAVNPCLLELAGTYFARLSTSETNTDLCAGDEATSRVVLSNSSITFSTCATQAGTRLSAFVLTNAYITCILVHCQ